MPDEELLSVLEDWRSLRLAYAASSDYVMRKAFEQTKPLEAFRGAAALAPAILQRYKGLADKTGDTVILGAHLYALQLTGDVAALRQAVVFSLEQRALRQDTCLAQFAGKIGAALLAQERSPGEDLSPGQLEAVLAALRRQEG